MLEWVLSVACLPLRLAPYVAETRPHFRETELAGRVGGEMQQAAAVDGSHRDSTALRSEYQSAALFEWLARNEFGAAATCTYGAAKLSDRRCRR